ncbi:S1 family peptidase, partial [Methylacidiphilales bacterium]|nr:S1 family peptidase [Candidatus Methylacidiphilales bacterium]
MHRIIITLLASLLITSARAVETESAGNTIYQTTQPTNAQVPNWTTGWAMSGITGWNYVGQVGGASGVYLGNGWVLTAGHVGMGSLTLDGVTYQPVSGSNHSLTNTNGTTADLALFQISTPPVLNQLTISLKAPTPFSQEQAGSQVVILGYGGGYGETWGYNTVDIINQLITPTGYSYVSNDFLTVFGTYTSGTASSTNNS